MNPISLFDKLFLMRKLILFIVWLILSSGYLLLAPQKNIISATACGETCYSSSDCPSDCNFCRTEQLNLESAQYFDQCSTGYCKCFKEDFTSIHEGGSEVIVDYVEPITGHEDSEPLVPLVEKVNKILPYAISIGGVIAFILIIIGGLQIILSSGNPDKVKAGKEMITSAIAGLLLIIFSVFILRLIGHDILDIKGFE